MLFYRVLLNEDDTKTMKVKHWLQVPCPHYLGRIVDWVRVDKTHYR